MDRCAGMLTALEDLQRAHDEYAECARPMPHRSGAAIQQYADIRRYQLPIPPRSTAERRPMPFAAMLQRTARVHRTWQAIAVDGAASVDVLSVVWIARASNAARHA
ncbi:MAG TPA: hypothetical protein PKA05_07950 [Roseiflexaceae bacterium]|nr:hypothetical protein [Roseiflexaceae bacterium]HMP40296.1 hypothetical protein [Roseiflexaceae bacterium]